MIDDDHTPTQSLGPSGEPLLGLQTRRETTPKDQKKKRPTREMPATMNYRPGKYTVDPLDKAAQDARGDRAEDVRLDEPLPVEIVESQIMWLVVARMSGGPWSHALVGENARCASFASKRRAEAITTWLAKTAAEDGTEVEYRVVPILRQEQQI